MSNVQTTDETITLLAADPARKFTASKYTVNGVVAHAAVVTCRSGSINYGYNSIVDLSTTGHILGAKQTMETDDIENFRFKATVDAVVYVTYYTDIGFTAIQG